jgi:Phage integrase family
LTLSPTDLNVGRQTRSFMSHFKFLLDRGVSHLARCFPAKRVVTTKSLGLPPDTPDDEIVRNRFALQVSTNRSEPKGFHTDSLRLYCEVYEEIGWLPQGLRVSSSPEPAATAFAVAGYMGLRHGEIRGLLWENYHDGEMYVSRSIWNGHVTAPKTRKGRTPVPVIRQLAERLEMHRLRSGNPQTGPIFANSLGKPLSMNNLLKRAILPALDRCEHCRKPKAEHGKADHQFKRDARYPEWHGWHAARRGLESNLYRLGVPEIVIQRILRHANVSTTASYYIKSAADDVRSAMELWDTVRDNKSRRSQCSADGSPPGSATEEGQVAQKGAENICWSSSFSLGLLRPILGHVHRVPLCYEEDVRQIQRHRETATRCGLYSPVMVCYGRIVTN